jgi:NADPH-dependent curcumin reductase CurA
MKKGIFITITAAVLTLVILVVACGGNVGAVCVLFAILLFGVVAMIFTSGPAKSQHSSERSPGAQALIDYNRTDCEAIASLCSINLVSSDEDDQEDYNALLALTGSYW